MTLTDIFTNLIFKKKPSDQVSAPVTPIKDEKIKEDEDKRGKKRKEIKLTIKDLENTIRNQKDDIENLKGKIEKLNRAEREIQVVQRRLATEGNSVRQKFTEYSGYLKKQVNDAQRREIQTALSILEKNLTEFKNAEIANQKTLDKIAGDGKELKRVLAINQRALSENERSLKMAVAAEGKVEIEEKGIEELEKRYLPEEEAAAEVVPAPKIESKRPEDETSPISKKTEEILPPPPPSPVTDDDYWKKGIVTNKKETG